MSTLPCRDMVTWSILTSREMGREVRTPVMCTLSKTFRRPAPSPCTNSFFLASSAFFEAIAFDWALADAFVAGLELRPMAAEERPNGPGPESEAWGFEGKGARRGRDL